MEDYLYIDPESSKYEIVFIIKEPFMNEIRFEAVTETILPELLAIYNHYIKNSTATFHIEPMTMAEMRELVFLQAPYQSYAIYQGTKLAGYCILHQYKKRPSYNDTAEITIYLKPEASGQQIGTQAVQFLETQARQAQFHSLIASICGENEPSIRLFERNGYQKCAHYREIGYKFSRYLDVVDYQKLL
jgi:L-amino acid N-acyltransferase YncA